ncbi:hypothetical protein M1N23_01370 [Dehalococcoidia bacterium]|nr:hypothetical protein [Dehalococcoidia bacterium]
MTKTWPIAAAAALVILLVASVTVTLVENEVNFDPGTVEATVQDFLRAVEEQELETVYGMFSAELKQECSAGQLFGQQVRYGDQLGWHRITLNHSSEVESTTFVSFRVSYFQGDSPFGSSDYSFVQRHALRQTEGEWEFVEIPWPLYPCPAKPTPTHSSLVMPQNTSIGG